MSTYSFIDCNYFNKDDKNKNIFNVQKEYDSPDKSKMLDDGILDPNVSIIEIKDIKKGE